MKFIRTFESYDPETALHHYLNHQQFRNYLSNRDFKYEDFKESEIPFFEKICPKWNFRIERRYTFERLSYLTNIDDAHRVVVLQFKREDNNKELSYYFYKMSDDYFYCIMVDGIQDCYHIIDGFDGLEEFLEFLYDCYVTKKTATRRQIEWNKRMDKIMKEKGNTKFFWQGDI